MALTCEEKPVSIRREQPEPEALPMFGGERWRHIHNLVYWALLAGMVVGLVAAYAGGRTDARSKRRKNGARHPR